MRDYFLILLLFSVSAENQVKSQEVTSDCYTGLTRTTVLYFIEFTADRGKKTSIQDQCINMNNYTIIFMHIELFFWSFWKNFAEKRLKAQNVVAII